jgi:hypothetical protein
VPIRYALSEIADRGSEPLGVFDGAEHLRRPSFRRPQQTATIPTTQVPWPPLLGT